MNYETEIKSDLGDASDVKFAERGGFARFTTGKGRWVIAIVLALAAIIGGYMLMSGGETAADDDRDAQAPSISVIAPGRTTVTGEITATGTLAARRSMPVGVVGIKFKVDIFRFNLKYNKIKLSIIRYPIIAKLST